MSGHQFLHIFHLAVLALGDNHVVAFTILCLEEQGAATTYHFPLKQIGTKSNKRKIVSQDDPQEQSSWPKDRVSSCGGIRFMHANLTSDMMAIRSPRRSASSIKWVLSIIVLPSLYLYQVSRDRVMSISSVQWHRGRSKHLNKDDIIKNKSPHQVPGATREMSLNPHLLEKKLPGGTSGRRIHTRRRLIQDDYF